MIFKFIQTNSLDEFTENGEENLNLKRKFIIIIKFLYAKILPKKIRKIIFLLNEPIQSINLNPIVSDRFGKNFKDFFITENMPSKLSILREGLDQESLKVIEQKLEQQLQLPSWGTKYQKNIRCLDRADLLYTEEQISEAKFFKKNLPDIKKQLNLKTYIPEVVFYRHGLTFLNQRVIKKIENSVIVDCGASYGDSAVMFGKFFNPSKIISFELTNNPKRAKKEYFQTIEKNQLPKSLYSFIPKGVGNINKDNIITLDKALENIPNISLIKMDIEGAAYETLLNSKNIIIRDRPIIVASVYHTPNEFFEIKPYIENLELNYSFMFRNLNFITNFELETVLICIPN